MTPQTPDDEPTISETAFDALLQSIRDGHSSSDLQIPSSEPSAQTDVRRVFQALRAQIRSANDPERIIAQRTALMTAIRRDDRALRETSNTARTRIVHMMYPTRRRWVTAMVSAVAVIGGMIGLTTVKDGRSHGTTRTYATRAGQLATVILGDGTRVTLAPQTTLRLNDFGGRLRAVSLDGEGYFEVQHVTGTPFTVRSGDATTTVLGTAFLIRHYAGDANVRVAVADGKVSVTGRSLPAPGLPLTAGHIGDISDSTVHVSTVDDLSPQTEWMRGKLIFRDAPILEVLATLSRWYGFQFRCNDTVLTRQTITAGLSTRSSAAALSTLEQVLDASAAIAGDTVTLVSRSSRPARQNTRTQSYDVFTPTREVGR